MDLVAYAPLNQGAIGAAFNLYGQLPNLESGQSITHLYLHWRVSGYTGCCADYNALVSLRSNPSGWVCEVQTDPRLNATSPVQIGYAAHTYMRNSRAFGLSLDGMMNATPSNFGPAPITLNEIETLCACAGIICMKYGIDASDPNLTMTHGEAAIHDGYFITDVTNDGVTRWDLARLSPSPIPLTKAECVATGNQLRLRIHNYKLHFISTQTTKVK